MGLNGALQLKRFTVVVLIVDERLVDTMWIFARILCEETHVVRVANVWRIATKPESEPKAGVWRSTGMVKRCGGWTDQGYYSFVCSASDSPQGQRTTRATCIEFFHSARDFVRVTTVNDIEVLNDHTTSFGVQPRLNSTVALSLGLSRISDFCNFKGAICKMDVYRSRMYIIRCFTIHSLY